MLKFLCGFLVFASSLVGLESKFLLLLGPSGTGKSTIISHLREKDSRFTYISPFITRDLRPGEVDKVYVSLEEMQKMRENGDFLCVNYIYGIYYATPKNLINKSLEMGDFPVLDWPVSKMDVMIENYKDRLFVVYVEPDNVDELANRLQNDNRDIDGKRLSLGLEELHLYERGIFDSFIDVKIVNPKGQSKEVADQIYDLYISSLK